VLDLKPRLQRCDKRPAMRVEIDLQVPLLGRLTPRDHIEQRTVSVEVLDWLLEQLGMLLFLQLHAGLPDQGGDGAQLAEHRAEAGRSGREWLCSCRFLLGGLEAPGEPLWARKPSSPAGSLAGAPGVRASGATAPGWFAPSRAPTVCSYAPLVRLLPIWRPRLNDKSGGKVDSAGCRTGHRVAVARYRAHVIDEAVIEEAGRRLSEAAPPGTRVVLFGSHARGEAGRHSDLDFLVIEPEVKDAANESVRLRRALRGLLLAADVIVVSEESVREWRDVRSSLIGAAMAEGRELAA
jgi:uncharacterized protein